ncbi:MAG: T9SS type A sorting domain-containing protein [Hymenobacter sp.]|nr:MAG: T9SS type A sorting domain-containing protein [Hymenobacter sp.]
MLVLEIIKNTRSAGTELRRVVLLALTLVLLLVVARVQAQTSTQTVLYSAGAPVLAQTCGGLGCSGLGVQVGTTTSIANLSLAARVAVPVVGAVARVRLQLSGTATGGYRAGMLLTNGSTVLGLQALGAVTLRTYLSTSDNSTPTTALDTKVVDISAAQLKLLADTGQPMQLEMLTTAGKDFNQVEIEFGSVLNAGTFINIKYAYGITANQSRTVPGYISRVGGSQIVTGCAEAIQNADRAVDADLTNFATMASLATVNCSAQLKVKLDGTAPGTYKAGFVVGNANNLLDVGLLNSGVTLRTYDADGKELESSSSSSLLGLNLLPDGRSLVSFQATKPFSYVSIERTGAVTVLDNMQLYYGLGVASTTVAPRVLSNFADGSNYYSTSQNGLLCVGSCGVTNPQNAAGSNNNSAATVNTTVGVGNSTTLRLDLNGASANVTDPPGRAGNRAGVVIGNSSILDVDLLSNATITTYKADGTLLETATGSSLLTLNVLPDGRRTVSFNTTQDFSKVGITFTNLVSAASNTDVYYAFADDSNGQLSITNPAGPLPVTLTSFAVRRVASSGAALVTWATASEVNSASFVVERSANPIDGFVAVGQVAAAGSSTTPRNYSLPDNGAALQTVTLYYRLRQLDTDGTAHLSPVAVLAAGLAKASFSIYPNPATGSTQQVTINATADLSAGYSVSVYSTMGQLLSTRVVSSEGAAAPLTVPTTGLATGVYHVVLRDAMGQSLSTQRLQVAN